MVSVLYMGFITNCWQIAGISTFQYVLAVISVSVMNIDDLT